MICWLLNARITLFLASEGRDLKRLLAEGAVQARISDSKTARGERLDYDVSAGKYVLTGSPATVIQKDITKGAATCSATNSPTLQLSKDASGKAQPDAVDTNKSGTNMLTLKNCDTWVIK